VFAVIDTNAGLS